ncbi:transcriptional regulatory protein [Diplodia corticola]|uniref:Transcriptional regulatory protein n=1 Tax=Diplodia corticola TaxID=236234 RepID=A0A1J9RWN2_9PEZI|nr:transcriptional regulatory protein [Diplodia corticola]OJD32244.1 transcriptional regulatory protein [Diplodia corticola]
MSDAEERAERPAEPSPNAACDQCRARKVRCDRRRPECSNCSKSGVCCGFTNQLKRVNHIKQLLNDFSSVTSRLESIENAIGNLSHQLVTISQPDSSSRSSRSGSRSSSASGRETLRNFLEECQMEEADCIGDDPAEFVHQGNTCCGCEQFFGETSAHSQFKSARDRVEQLLRADNQDGGTSLLRFVSERPSLPPDLQCAYEVFPAVEECHRPFSTMIAMNGTNGRPIALPPKNFLLSALDIFLAEINTYNPIFEESSLREAVELRYSMTPLDPDPDREAWSLSFNNIILLAMCHSARLTHNAFGDFQGIEHDLFQSFLRNTCRAFHSLERLSSPRFVNIQALATFALVGRECFEGCFFSLMLPRAFQILRSTGLHRAQAHKTIVGASCEERRMLYWTLYRLDKQRCFLKGQPCDLYSFDTDIPMADSETDTPQSRYLFAMNSLMVVWEKIYLLLYSPRVKKRRRRDADQQVCELRSALKGWCRRHGDLLEKPESDGSYIFLRAELSFCFAMSSLLIHRCIDSVASRQKCLESAQTALRVIANIHKAQPRSGSIAFLARIFQQYPALPFLEVYHHILYDPTPERLSLVSLLSAAVQAVGDLVNPNFPRVFCASLYARMAWCVDLLEMFRSSACSPSHASRKGSVESSTLPSRNGSVGDLDGFNELALNAASDSAFFGADDMMGKAQTADQGHGFDDIFNPEGLTMGSDFPDGQVAVGVDMAKGADLFRLSMDVDDSLWSMSI